jgi:hypothetical protein
MNPIIELSIKLSNYITTLELKDRLLAPFSLHCLATDDDSIASFAAPSTK